MKATDLLQEEHDTILRALGLVESAAENVRSGLPLAAACKSWIASFVDQFVDGCHCAKEEQLFFPLLKQRGLRSPDDPIDWPQQEHDLCRRLAGKMTTALEGDDMPGFVRSAEDYIALMRQHILKESNVLFVLAGKLLSSDDDKGLVVAFEQKDQGAPARREQLEREMQRWVSVLATARGRRPQRPAKASFRDRPRANAMR